MARKKNNSKTTSQRHVAPNLRTRAQQQQHGEEIIQDLEPEMNSPPPTILRTTAATPAVPQATVRPMPITQLFSGRSEGIQNYSPCDLMALLDTIEEVRPIGLEQWERVLVQ